MNVDKANLKVLIATDIGADIEDRMEAEQKAAVELDGASRSLAAAAKKVPFDLCAEVDKDPNISDGMTSLEVAELVKKYLTRAGNFLAHLADVSRQRSIHQFARAEGLRDAMEAVSKMREGEILKIKGYNQLLEQVDASDDEVVPPLPSRAPKEDTPPRTSAGTARAARGSASDRKSAEDSARAQRGSTADRKAAEATQEEPQEQPTAEVEIINKPPPAKTAPRKKPENAKKKPKAPRRKGASKKR